MGEPSARVIRAAVRELPVDGLVGGRSSAGGHSYIVPKESERSAGDPRRVPGSYGIHMEVTGYGSRMNIVARLGRSPKPFITNRVDSEVGTIRNSP